MNFDMKEEALKLIEKGFRVVPCNGKIPKIKNGLQSHFVLRKI